MYLDFYGNYKLAKENEDIYSFYRKHGCMDSEVAKQLDMGQIEFWVMLGEPLTNNEKRMIAKAARDVFELHYREARDRIITQQENAAMREYNKKKYGTIWNKPCLLNNGKVYSGQFRNYEMPGNQWDA